MQKLKNKLIGIFNEIMRHKVLLVLLIAIVAVGGIFAVREAIAVDHTHQTFENYYAFRGCAQLLEKTDTYGTCRTTSGDVIKMVKFRDKWYLDGDLPTCWDNFCF